MFLFLFVSCVSSFIGSFSLFDFLVVLCIVLLLVHLFVSFSLSVCFCFFVSLWVLWVCVPFVKMRNADH